ncbi:uncharacterized protein RSE6_11693 [Rhynchosporium secalis]|uniref:Protein kinase domain-containing protein n=1 Tax=Rhynchosporium secalis TaxID=38038 RepID=A0A1E1MNK3_RHYSE|nr:uncharacterized protein RSE6_11693 [Rhynchosporium secalis]
MPPKRDFAEADLVAESPQAKKQRLAEASSDNDAIPDIMPTGPKLASKPPKKVRVVPTSDEILAMTVKQRRQFRQENWLRRSFSWDEFTIPGGVYWKGVKVLGQGTYGVAGLFKYIGPNESTPKSIVVKQCGPTQRHALIRESRILAELATAGSKHIVKLFKSIFYTAGTGAHPSWDPIPYTRTLRANGTAVQQYDPDLQVSKIYLEHCEEGDLWAHQKKVNPTHEHPSEEYIWRLLECYVRGLYVLATGKEEPIPEAPKKEASTSEAADQPTQSTETKVTERKKLDVPEISSRKKGEGVLTAVMNASLEVILSGLRTLTIGHPNVASPETPALKSSVTEPGFLPKVAEWKPIIHFDVKPDNLLVGKTDDNHQNPSRGIHKFADFGQARHTPPIVTPHFIAYGRFCGAKGIKPPEQMYEGAQNVDIGKAGDLWSIATTIYALILKKYIPTSVCRITFINSASGLSESYETQGSDLLTLDDALYSNTLLNVLMRCLAFKVVDRPSLDPLKRTIDEAIAALERQRSLDQKDPFFDFTEGNLEDGEDVALLSPDPLERYGRVDSLVLDNARMPLWSPPARVDVLGFTPDGAPSLNIDGNTAVYSVQAPKFLPFLSTPMLLAQQQRQQQQQQQQQQNEQRLHENADVSEYELDG